MMPEYGGLSRVDRESKRLVPLREADFSQEGFQEVTDLQTWLFEKPEVLGEDLLMLAKGYSGFHGTREEIDLLALDKEGNVVVIEVKRDDSGSEVHWQAIKYASYMAGFSKEDLAKIYADTYSKSGEEAFRDVYNFVASSPEEESPVLNERQRILLVAHRFRPEVLSAVAWLLKSSRSAEEAGVDIKCICLIPFKDQDDRLFVTNRAILPVYGEEQFLIGPPRTGKPAERGPTERTEIDSFKRLLMEKLPEFDWRPYWTKPYSNVVLQPAVWIDIYVRRRGGVVAVGITTNKADVASTMDTVYEHSGLASKRLAGKWNIECTVKRRDHWRRYESELPFEVLTDITNPVFIADVARLIEEYEKIYEEYLAAEIKKA